MTWITVALLGMNIVVRLFLSHRRQKEEQRAKQWERQLEQIRQGNPVSRLEFPENSSALVTVVSVWNQHSREATSGQLTRLRTYARKHQLLDTIDTAQDRLSRSKRCVLIRLLGLLGDSRAWTIVESNLRSGNLFLTIASLRALVRINATRGLSLVFEKITQNKSIQPAQLEDLISQQTPEVVSDSLEEAVKGQSPEERTRLIPYFRFGEQEASRKWLKREINRCWDDDETVASCLKTLSHYEHLEDLSLLATCCEREFWPIRLHTASCLGRVQREEAVPVLKKLLADTEWWVRRHAAQALYEHDCVTDSQYQNLMETHSDNYGRDMLREIRSSCETSNVITDG